MDNLEIAQLAVLLNRMSVSDVQCFADTLIHMRDSEDAKRRIVACNVNATIILLYEAAISRKRIA